VLEDRKPRHQPCRQRRLACAILVNGAEFLFQESPVFVRASFTSACSVSMICSSRERNSSCSPLSRRSRGRIKILRSSTRVAENHGFRFEGIPYLEFARKSMPRPPFPANPIAGIQPIFIANQTLRHISRRTCDVRCLLGAGSRLRNQLAIRRRQPCSLLNFAAAFEKPRRGLRGG
jgi:hypothetical protein